MWSNWHRAKKRLATFISWLWTWMQCQETHAEVICLVEVVVGFQGWMDENWCWSSAVEDAWRTAKKWTCPCESRLLLLQNRFLSSFALVVRYSFICNDTQSSKSSICIRYTYSITLKTVEYSDFVHSALLSSSSTSSLKRQMRHAAAEDWSKFRPCKNFFHTRLWAN